MGTYQKRPSLSATEIGSLGEKFGGLHNEFGQCGHRDRSSTGVYRCSVAAVEN